VVGRLDAERLDTEDLPPGAAIISITNPGQKPAQLEAFRHVLRLGFLDDDVAGPRAMSLEDALAVLRFVREHRAAALFVHCEYGQSRSPAVAQLLAAWLQRDVVADAQLANALVARRMRVAAWREGLRTQDFALLRAAWRLRL
jgi:predicted protein tyrosine phosphatase